MHIVNVSLSLCVYVTVYLSRFRWLSLRFNVMEMLLGVFPGASSSSLSSWIAQLRSLSSALILRWTMLEDKLRGKASDVQTRCCCSTGLCTTLLHWPASGAAAPMCSMAESTWSSGQSSVPISPSSGFIIPLKFCPWMGSKSGASMLNDRSRPGTVSPFAAHAASCN